MSRRQIKSALGGSPRLFAVWGSISLSVLLERRMLYRKKQISSQIPSCYNVTDCCKVQKIANHLTERVLSGVALY